MFHGGDRMTRIRRATEADAESIRDVHVASIRELCYTHYTPTQIAGWLDGLMPDNYRSAVDVEIMVVAEHDTEIVGFGSLFEPDAEIRAVYVRPDDAACGIGRQILRELEAYAIRSGLRKLSLNATLNAVGFYQREGYGNAQAATHRSGSGNELPCVSMTKTLSQARGE